MKKMLGLRKEEKIVLIVGLFLIAVCSIAGIVKSSFNKEEPYRAVTPQPQPSATEEKFKIKNEKFAVEAGTAVDEDVSTYVEAAQEEIGKVSLDFSQVDINKAGSYPASATLEDKKKEFKIEVVVNKLPIIQVERPNFQFVIDINTTMKEVIDYAGVTAVDRSGKNLSADITGWDEQIPPIATTITYKLIVKDENGYSSSIKVTVEYLILK